MEIIKVTSRSQTLITGLKYIQKIEKEGEGKYKISHVRGGFLREKKTEKLLQEWLCVERNE